MENKRQFVLSIAREQFEQNGIDGTSLRGIATAANVSRSYIEYNFHSKDNLLASCLEPWGQVVKARIDELVDLGRFGDDPIEVAYAALTKAFYMTRHHADTVRLTQAVLARKDELPLAYEAVTLPAQKIRLAACISVITGQPIDRAQAMGLYTLTIVAHHALSTERELLIVYGGDPSTVVKRAAHSLTLSLMAAMWPRPQPGNNEPLVSHRQ